MYCECLFLYDMHSIDALAIWMGRKVVAFHFMCPFMFYSLRVKVEQNYVVIYY